MKKRTLKIFSLLTVLVILGIGLQSFVADGDDDDDANKKKEPSPYACTYTCWYQTSSGRWYFINRAGTGVDCDTGGTSCTVVDCHPIIPCDQ